ncbi:MAG: hypothetical protein EOP47_30810 [Sphingobacteriaceae bacterium]|nr:MAG: hypothetical protein EOP47_30810 [Sphingobacteriaceae bacterium]
MKLKLILLFLSTSFFIEAKAQTGIPFAGEIREFQHQDSLNFPKPGGILFIGSSSIRYWADLEQRFAGKPVIKRGLGGSKLMQWAQYFIPYMVIPYQPKKIFIYAGENDFLEGRTAVQVTDDFKKVWETIHEKLPDTKIYYMAIKGSPSRLKYINEMYLCNKLVKAYIDTRPNTKYLDVSSVLLKKDTMFPDSSLFKPDYLHLNSKGYDKWQKVLNEYVK